MFTYFLSFLFFLTCLNQLNNWKINEMTPKLTGSRSSVQNHWWLCFVQSPLVQLVLQPPDDLSSVLHCKSQHTVINYELQWQHWVWARTWGDRGGQLPQVKTGCLLGGWGGVSWQGNILCHVTDLHAKHGNNHTTSCFCCWNVKDSWKWI